MTGLDAGAATTSDRHYGMDWLRIGAFGLLIFYHVGLVFSPWGYEVKSSHTYGWVAVPLLLLNAWRLSLLFAISGYASAALFASGGRHVGAFVRVRLARLGIPLLFGMAVIVTPQPWVQLVTQQGYTHDFAYFLMHDYYGFKHIGTVAMPTWMHLWFVVYLMVYTLIVAALLTLPAGLRGTLRRGAEHALVGPLFGGWRLGGWGLLVLPIGYLFLARLLPHGWSDTHALFGDWAAHASYLPMVLFGWLLRGSEPLRRAIARQWPIAAALAVAGYAVVAGAELAYPGTTPLPPGFVKWFNLAREVQCWGAIVALFGIADRYWNHDAPGRATLAEAVFPFYIIHQTIILVAGYWLLQTRLPGSAEFAILVAATAGGCWLFYLAGRAIGPLRPLIGLKRHPSGTPLATIVTT